MNSSLDYFRTECEDSISDFDSVEVNIEIEEVETDVTLNTAPTRQHKA